MNSYRVLSSDTPVQAIPLKQIIQDPLAAYAIFKQRIQTDGQLAPFPEFAPAVLAVENAINSFDMCRLTQDEPELEEFRILALTRLLSVQAQFRVEGEHPQIVPYKQAYPYIPTIEALRDGITLLDVMVRHTYDDLPPLYHTDRYMHHYSHIYRSNFIYFPCVQDLSFRAFICTRSVPISFLGVSTTPVHADGYYNSPLDYFMHDVNHVRRLEGYNQALLQKHPELLPEDVYRMMNDFIQEHILPATKITAEMSVEEKHIRQIVTILAFEYLHELAFTPDSDSLKAAILQAPGGLSPFEHLVDENFDKSRLEELRLPNYNIASGYSRFFQPAQTPKPPIVRYFFDSFPNFITSAYNKCTSDFFDTNEHRAKYLPPLALRTEDLFTQATMRFLAAVNEKDLLTENDIRKLLQSKKATITYPVQREPTLKLKSQISTQQHRPE